VNFVNSLKNKIVLITGATSGIGKETAIGLAKLDCTIVLTTRDMQRGKSTKDEIINASNNNKIDLLYCDLSSFDSIRSCCDQFKAKYGQLHVLINNAGVWKSRRDVSKDGIEITFAVNYLAPFLMTNLLLDPLKKGAPSRIINLSSGYHGGSIHFDDMEFKRSFSGRNAYKQSKLVMILFTKILAEKLKATGVTVNCVNPGFIATNLARELNFVLRVCFKFFGKNPKKGAETSIYLASSPEVENISGQYFVNKKIRRSSKESNDMKVAKKLWDPSAEYVHLGEKKSEVIKNT
jgi:NAD(P)-dependent dehydrogenase (short-subunit alcohol dehydrogenase family)